MGNGMSANQLRNALKPKIKLEKPSYNANFEISDIEKDCIMSFIYNFHTRKLYYLDIDFKLPNS